MIVQYGKSIKCGLKCKVPKILNHNHFILKEDNLERNYEKIKNVKKNQSIWYTKKDNKNKNNRKQIQIQIEKIK